MCALGIFGSINILSSKLITICELITSAHSAGECSRSQIKHLPASAIFHQSRT